jgi:TatD DNase family protein
MLATKEISTASKSPTQRTITELADAHCHLDLMNPADISEAVGFGVKTLITNGVDTKSNIASLKLADGKNIFAVLGVDPEHAAKMDDSELEANIKMIRENASKIVGIGEIGLDKGGRIENFERQKAAFAKLIDLAEELKLPISIHSRNTMEEVLTMLESKGVRKAHIHFFDGDVMQAKRAERLGYMISIPPLESGKRRKVIKEVSIDNIMVESDSPVAVKSPKEVVKAIEMIAEEKRLDVQKVAQAVVANTKRYFNIGAKPTLMRI